MSSRPLKSVELPRCHARWRMTCAGSFSILDEAGVNRTPRGRKARAIIVYLAAHAGSQIPREKITDLLWGDRGEAQARSSLRQALFEVRRCAPGLLWSDRDHVSIAHNSIQMVGDAGHEEFFADLNHVSPAFDEWLEGERRQSVTTAWNRLRDECARMLACGKGRAAISLLDDMTRLDPYNEDGARLAMQAEFQAGHAAGIDKRFKALASVLKRDLQVEPAAETRALRDKLLGELTRSSKASDPKQEDEEKQVTSAAVAAVSPIVGMRQSKRWWPLIIAVLILGLTALTAAWRSLGQASLPVVAVSAADSTPHTQQLSRDLLVKLGTLADVGAGRWRLMEAANSEAKPAYIFRPSESIIGSDIKANLLLLDGGDDSVLWAREFHFARGSEGDLRQQVSLTAGRVLGCVLDARQSGGLPPDLLRLFLTGCAISAELSEADPQEVAGMMRDILAKRPSFAPAWALLLLADARTLQVAQNKSLNFVGARRQLERDIAIASRRIPDLPEIGLARLELLPPTAYGQALDLIAQVKARAPANPLVWIEESAALSSVGRMSEAVAAGRKAAELDPLSPAISRSLIEILAWAGEREAARLELARAGEMWAGTAALKDAQFAFHLRYGDPRVARSLIDGMRGGSMDAYLRARLDPTPEAIDALKTSFAGLSGSQDSGKTAYAVQALAEFDQVDEVFGWLQRAPRDTLADMSYILFRPALDDVRRDPRMMQVARRIGLLGYWSESGQWPDFCSDQTLPYRCTQYAERGENKPMIGRWWTH